MNANFHRLKKNFTSGELSPWLSDRLDLEKYNNGCISLENAYVMPQGPVRNRSGFKFIYDLTSLGFDFDYPYVRLIPFVASDIAAYGLLFYNWTDGTNKEVRVVFISSTGGLIVYPDPPPTECPAGNPISVNAGDIVYVKMLDGFDKTLKFDYAQSSDTLFIAQENQVPSTIKRYSNTCWQHSLIDFGGTAPTEWTTGNYPRLVVLHQQRLVFASTTNERQRVWLSEAGNLLNFGGTNVPSSEKDPFSFSLASGNQNRIQWMVSSKALLLGTLGGEWTVSGSTYSSLTYSNLLAQRQTNNGGEDIKPLVVGYTTLFIERHGRVINEYLYDYTYDGYRNTDLSILANHLTLQTRYIDWTYQQTPNGIVWLINDEGNLIGLTYQRQHKVVGFHRHTTDGLFKAITCIPRNDTREDALIAVINREIDGKAKFYIEIMSEEFKFDNADNGRFVDSWVDGTGSVVGNVVYGLEHLEGKEVSILADGMVHPNRVVENGLIQLDNNYTHVVVGLQYITTIIPNLSEIPTKNGTTLGRMQRIVNIDIDFYKSLGGKLVRIDLEDDEIRDEEILFRQVQDTTNKQLPLFSGIKHLSFPEGFSRRSMYAIKQEDPLPLCMLSVVDSIKINEA